MRATGIDKLGEKEYMKLLQEVDLMTQMPVNIEELINKRMKEIEERLAAEQQEKEAVERRETRSQASKASTSKTTDDIGSVPAQRSSPRKRKTDAEPKKDKPTKETGDKRSRTDDTDDASKNRKQKGAKRPKQKKTAAIPMLMDDNDDVDDDLMVIDDKDKDYEPQPEEDDNDIYPMDDDDNDFQEPPPRARKSVEIVSKTSKKPTKAAMTRQVDKSTKDKEGDADDETISLFQKIVGPDFEVRASEEFEDNTRDKCGNPVEVAGFRVTMKMLTCGLKTAVKKGEAIEETYVDMIQSTIEVAKAMRYPGASTVEVKDILASIKDRKCNAWQKYLKGATRMEPTDVVMDEDNVPENEDDLVIQGPILGKEATEAAAEAIHKLPKMLLADTKK